MGTGTSTASSILKSSGDGSILSKIGDIGEGEIGIAEAGGAGEILLPIGYGIGEINEILRDAHGKKKRDWWEGKSHKDGGLNIVNEPIGGGLLPPIGRIGPKHPFKPPDLDGGGKIKPPDIPGETDLPTGGTDVLPGGSGDGKIPGGGTQLPTGGTETKKPTGGQTKPGGQTQTGGQPDDPPPRPPPPQPRPKPKPDEKEKKDDPKQPPEPRGWSGDLPAEGHGSSTSNLIVEPVNLSILAQLKKIPKEQLMVSDLYNPEAEKESDKADVIIAEEATADSRESRVEARKDDYMKYHLTAQQGQYIISSELQLDRIQEKIDPASLPDFVPRDQVFSLVEYQTDKKEKQYIEEPTEAKFINEKYIL